MKQTHKNYMLPFKRSKKFRPLLYSLTFIITLDIVTITIKKAGYHIIYSATASMPRGFYLVIPTKKIALQDIIEFTPPPNALEFAQKNRWIPQSGSIIKYVFAVPDDHICTYNQKILINNKEIAPISKFYAKNKLLPQINFCGKLSTDQYLLLSIKSKRSFDGRYFGPISSQKILGKAIHLF